MKPGEERPSRSQTAGEVFPGGVALFSELIMRHCGYSDHECFSDVSIFWTSQSGGDNVCPCGQTVTSIGSAAYSRRRPGGLLHPPDGGKMMSPR